MFKFGVMDDDQSNVNKSLRDFLMGVEIVSVVVDEGIDMERASRSEGRSESAEWGEELLEERKLADSRL